MLNWRCVRTGRVWLATWALGFAGLLAGCGGGGGGEENLTVDFHYQGDSSVDLYAASVQTAVLNGLNGHTPQCVVASGTLPPGITVQSNCQISGTATAPGVYSVTVRLTVSGFKGDVTADVGFTVFGPTLNVVTAPGLPAGVNQVLNPGSAQTALPVVTTTGYRPLAGDSLQYLVVSGNLPPGLSLDPTSGTLSGAPTTIATTSADIAARLQRNGQTYTSPVASVVLQVDEPLLSVTYTVPTYQVADSINVLPVSSFVAAQGAAITYSSVSPLPPGIQLDAATGALTGKATVPGDYTVNIQATETLPGSVTRQAPSNFFTLSVRGVFPFYPVTSLGTSASYAPPGDYPYVVSHALKPGQSVQVEAGPIFGLKAGDQLSYAITTDPIMGGAAPSWVSVDPVTGRVDATAPTGGLFILDRFGVLVTLTRGGATYRYAQGWLFQGSP